MTRLRNPDRIAWTVLAMMAGCLVAASAQAAKPAPIAPVVQEVIDCRKLEDTTARLACYDKAVDGMAKADANGDLITVDRQQREALRHQAFGLSLPSLLIFERGAKSDDINRITATVKSAAQDAYGNWTIVLEDGATWRQIEAADVFRPPHPGSTVAIRRASLGSYFMNIDGQIAIRVRREN